VRKIIPVVAGAASALVVAGGTVAYAAANKDVTLSVDGAASTLHTTAGTVGGLLAQRGITVTDHDVVAPSATSALRDGTRVAVQFGRQVTVNVDGKPATFWTTATNVGQALTSLGVATDGAVLSTSRSDSIGRQGLTFDLATLKSVTITVGGVKKTVQTTATTVAGALAVAHIRMDDNDLLSVDQRASLTNGASFSYTKVDIRSTTTTQRVAHGMVRKSSSSLSKGVTSVRQSGHDGSRTVTYRDVLYDGKLKSRKVVSTKVTTQPSTRVVLVGTKVVRASSSPSHSSRSHSSSYGRSAPSSSRSSAPAVASGSVWDRLAGCESGGNWHINTGNGFYGGVQFTLSTWHAYGGSGLPSNASREQQIAIAQKLQASAGWGQWPACSGKLGLR
jgi:uncharacterized protein YabE (DUF348 family)